MTQTRQKEEIRNAEIEKTFLGIEEHGIFTFWLHLDYGSTAQSAGGFVLSSGNGWSIIKKILKVVGVNKWEELVGEHIRVRCGHNCVYAIGHFLNDDWLDFEKEAGK